MPRRAMVVAIVALLAPSAASAQGPTPKKSDMALKVQVHPLICEKGGPVQEVHQKLADQLAEAKIGVPDDRVSYFQHRPAPKNAPFIGWHAFIESIDPTRDGGAVVLLSVHPRYDGATTSNELHERYYVRGKQIKYLGASIPPSARFPYLEIN